MSDHLSLSTARPGQQMLLRGLLWAVLILFAVWFLLPAYVVVGTSMKELEEIRSGSLLALPHELNFTAWRHAWSEACIGVECTGLEPYFWNSVRMALPAVAISTLLGALTGFALTKFRFRGANLVFALILFGCFVPFQVVILPMAQTLGRLGITNTVYGLILVHSVYGLAFTTLFFRNYYVTIPDELVRAATIDGAGFFTIFWRIILPLSPPIIVVSVIWQFTQIWNDFLFGASFTTGGAQPVTVALNNLVNTTTGVKQYNVDMAAALITAAPTLFVYIVAGRYFVRGLTAGSVKG
ncbi:MULTISPECIES: carbohydrate ABC transporter permease [Rhodobacterales]|jgi:glucose/mannose transport system permease protein|uniref:carbohydrate ABC transporter permease n=1 Tax=Rhodobacterales TaxID=204455 RepID=UPI00237F9315|nr:carbohydrate ABC transporter permease [Phaeobacter gallaeciensis]MDE4140762.1 carbohydrate ABC transporter permease [Phaeobacter gallaeciensis]MDE4149207.1 carbohydrate ABC transporter permease [Phaeobacter gallaeciensis]MDE4153600.1 carbohydrate ABC transporter permease [Phaeobacter gallaeciensis]MDE4191833.1 carbohydrate ABC transporter permease [Phaeobacter gallaeciensis]MDE4200296.1 carbohydrate ABC transporter permease [Phaeobacter gallaeciensis]